MTHDERIEMEERRRDQIVQQVNDLRSQLRTMEEMLMQQLGRLQVLHEMRAERDERPKIEAVEGEAS